MGLFQALRRLTAHDRRIRDAEEALRELERRCDALDLEGRDLRDTARRMLNRANAQRRWISEKEAKEEPNGDGRISVDELNQAIMEGRYAP